MGPTMSSGRRNGTGGGCNSAKARSVVLHLTLSQGLGCSALDLPLSRRIEKKGRCVKKSAFAALLCSLLFAIPALAESADHRGPDPDKGRVLGGVGGAGNQKRANSDKGRAGSKQHGTVAGVAGTGGAGAAAGAGGPDGQSEHTGVAGRLADFAGNIFGGTGEPDTGRGNSDVRGAPGPIAGTGLPFLGIGYGIYWLIKRRRRKRD